MVEDNPDDELLTLDALRTTGTPCEIAIARDGVEALEYLFADGAYAGRDQAVQPCLVLLDLKLPKLSGFDVLDRMRSDQRTKFVPVVLLTSSSQDEDMIRGYSLRREQFRPQAGEVREFSRRDAQSRPVLVGSKRNSTRSRKVTVRTPLKVLIVENSENDAILMVDCLAQAGYDPAWTRVETAAAFVSSLAPPAEWDIILCDYSMPGFGGQRALKLYQQSGLDIPFILISGSIGEERAVEAMHSGVHDYIMKDRMQRLAPAVDRELREAANRKARRTAVDENQRLNSESGRAQRNAAREGRTVVAVPCRPRANDLGSQSRP